MIFYFTGTGNSLYIAKQIEKNLISIPQVIHNQNLNFSAESIGIVAPIYGHEIPNMVREFMKKATFNTNYFYMILTYGNRHGGASELAKKFCKECGINLSYINVIMMVDNWLPSFDMNEQIKINKHTEDNISIILKDLKSHKIMISPVTETDRAAHQEFLAGISKMPDNAWQHLLKIKENCIGCGICEKVCPSASIKIVNKKAVYTPGNCQTCLACVHACPQKAIGLTIPEKNPNARYRNEHVSLQEIIKANFQY